MLTLFVSLSIIIGQISAYSIDTVTFNTIYQNPQSQRTNQLGEPCIKVVADTPTGGYVYCKSPNNDIRKCTEVTRATGVQFIVCDPPVQTQTEAPQLPLQPSKPDDKHDDCSVCAMDQIIKTMDQKIDERMQIMDQRIHDLLNQIHNLQSASTKDRKTDEVTDKKTHEILLSPPSTTDDKTDETTTLAYRKPDDTMTMRQFMAVYNVLPDKRTTNTLGEICVKASVTRDDTLIPAIYCKIASDDEYAHLCEMDKKTNEVVCPSPQSSPIGNPAAVQLRDNDNTIGYTSSNDSDRLQENIKMSLIGMWVVLALIVIVNAIFIWCYMKRNKQRTYDLE